MNTASFVFFIIAGLFAIAAFAGLCVLQVHLSRKRSPGPGLVLPIVSLVLILTIVLPIFLFTAHTNQSNGLEVITVEPAISSVTPVKPDGMTDEEFDALVKEKEDLRELHRQMEEALHAQANKTTARSAPILFSAVLLPLMFVPTLTFTVIYIVCRVSLRRNPPAAPGNGGGYASPAEIRKMNIQDL